MTEAVPAEKLYRAGLSARFAAAGLDMLILLPALALSFWGFYHYRLFRLYSLGPHAILILFYSVYLVRRYGGTPGKIIMGIRIRKMNGDAIGYREAILRILPAVILGFLVSAGSIYASLRMSDGEFHTFTRKETAALLAKLSPGWLKPASTINTCWLWLDLIALLMTRNSRALHDFAAGTVVVLRSPPKIPALDVASTAPARRRKRK